MRFSLKRHRLDLRAPRDEEDVEVLRTIWFTRRVLAEIALTIGVKNVERGGMLGGTIGNDEITHYHHDVRGRRTYGSYTPDHRELTRVLQEEWNPADVRLLGFAHSHPAVLMEPSNGDVEYAQRILEYQPELPYLLTPIVRSAREGRFEVFPFVIHRETGGRDDVVEECRFGLIADDDAFTTGVVARDDAEDDRLFDHASFDDVDRESSRTVVATGFDVPASAAATECPGEVAATPPRESPPSAATSRATDARYERTFRRVTGAYDLDLMSECRVVAVGAGGAATYLEELARCGVGEFVLIDPDCVSESNLATQQTYRRDVGRFKVDCIRERILDVNPRASVLSIWRSLDDLDDSTLRRLCLDTLLPDVANTSVPLGLPETGAPDDHQRPPRRTLLALLTDSFPAQARGNRIALNLGVPYLAAQVYREGCGAEIVFSEPTVTPACTRCALQARYRAYLEEEFRNDVTSDGTPIFATGRLNALKGFLSLALLHHGSDHPRWGGLLQRIGKRNLVQIRMDPDAPLPVFDRVFEGADAERLLFDEVVWLPQDPDCEATGHPTCPDCGGTGDLNDAIGTISDTRLPTTT